jgi:hypothetical protein
MPENQLVECLKQKVVLLTCISDISRRIEKQCELPDIEIGELLEHRQVYIDRLMQCDGLVHTLTEKLAPGKKVRIHIALSSHSQKEDCENEEEQELFQLEARCRTLLRGIAAMDRESIHQVQEARDHVKKRIERSRKNNKKTASPRSSF